MPRVIFAKTTPICFFVTRTMQNYVMQRTVLYCVLLFLTSALLLARYFHFLPQPGLLFPHPEAILTSGFVSTAPVSLVCTTPYPSDVSGLALS